VVEFKRVRNFGITMYESTETVTDELNIKHPRYRIVKEGQLFTVREYKNGTYEYNIHSGSTASKTLAGTIEWLNVELGNAE
jgi:hypothetical protein